MPLAVAGGALVLVVAIVLALGWRSADQPPTVTEPVVTVPAVELRILDADDTGALLVADGTLHAVDAAGESRWTRPLSQGGARCLSCPAALVDVGAPGGALRVDAAGRSQPAADLTGALALGGAWIHAEARGLRVRVPTGAGTTDLGTLPARTLDPSAYAFAPSVAVATDGRSGAAVVGLADPLEPGRAEGWYLRAGTVPRSIPIELTQPGVAPGVCRPLPGTDRWGWVEVFPGDQPWLGTARFVPVAGGRAGTPVPVDLPVSSCAVTPDGYVLTFTSSGPGGTSAGAAWVDGTGRVVRTAATRDERTSGSASASGRTGRVLLPVTGGFRLHDAGADRGRVEADDARLAPGGRVWVVRGRRVRLEDGP